MIKPRLRHTGSLAGLKIGLLGGSFNPAHQGHLAISLLALRALELDQVWFLVSPQNPLKSSKEMASFTKRLASAKRLFVHPSFYVSDLEKQLGTHYTVDTLKALKRKYPLTRFIWLMGADNLRQMPYWKNWQMIFHLVPVAVFRRPSYSAGRNFGKAALRFAKEWRNPRQGRDWSKKRLALPLWIVLDNKLNDISASQIRKEKPSW